MKGELLVQALDETGAGQGPVARVRGVTNVDVKIEHASVVERVNAWRELDERWASGPMWRGTIDGLLMVGDAALILMRALAREEATVPVSGGTKHVFAGQRARNAGQVRMWARYGDHGWRRYDGVRLQEFRVTARSGEPVTVTWEWLCRRVLEESAPPSVDSEVASGPFSGKDVRISRNGITLEEVVEWSARMTAQKRHALDGGEATVVAAGPLAIAGSLTVWGVPEWVDDVESGATSSLDVVCTELTTERWKWTTQEVAITTGHPSPVRLDEIVTTLGWRARVRSSKVEMVV